ncbi:MAG: serine/threonine-protein kinase [Gemmataceae bacterium]
MNSQLKQTPLDFSERDTLAQVAGAYPARSTPSTPRALGPYRLLRPLGSGGMGDVYLAEYCPRGLLCAVKILRPEHAADPRLRARFEREARLASHASHPNVVAIFDHGQTDDGACFYAMEYLPGLDLEELIERAGPLPVDRVIDLVRQACRGLAAAHAQGLVHRDIKPANLFLVERDGRDLVKLLDFGLVKPRAESTSERLTQDGAISGTPLFMSPEQACGRPADCRSDIYSLGAVAYALLTGRPPFERQHSLELLIAHARDEVTAPSQVRADIPPDLERVILRCLAKSPEDRYQDAAGLEKALEQALAATRETAATGKPPPRSTRLLFDGAPCGIRQQVGPASRAGPDGKMTVSRVFTPGPARLAGPTAESRTLIQTMRATHASMLPSGGCAAFRGRLQRRRRRQGQRSGGDL